MRFFTDAGVVLLGRFIQEIDSAKIEDVTIDSKQKDALLNILRVLIELEIDGKGKFVSEFIKGNNPIGFINDNMSLLVHNDYFFVPDIHEGHITSYTLAKICQKYFNQFNLSEHIFPEALKRADKFLENTKNRMAVSSIQELISLFSTNIQLMLVGFEETTLVLDDKPVALTKIECIKKIEFEMSEFFNDLLTGKVRYDQEQYQEKIIELLRAIFRLPVEYLQLKDTGLTIERGASDLLIGMLSGDMRIIAKFRLDTHLVKERIPADENDYQLYERGCLSLLSNLRRQVDEYHDKHTGKRKSIKHFANIVYSYPEKLRVIEELQAKIENLLGIREKDTGRVPSYASALREILASLYLAYAENLRVSKNEKQRPGKAAHFIFKFITEITTQIAKMQLMEAPELREKLSLYDTLIEKYTEQFSPDNKNKDEDENFSSPERTLSVRRQSSSAFFRGQRNELTEGKEKGKEKVFGDEEDEQQPLQRKQNRPGQN